MARYFRKRRKNQGPNKNEEKVQRAEDARNQERSGGMGTRFPAVKQLRIHLAFMSAQKHILEEKDFNLGPADACVVTAACPGRCGSGSFDFTEKLIQAVQARQAVSECGAKCPLPIYAGSAEACGCEVRCRMDVDYFPAPAPIEAAQP
mgnify:CR=1 FL=1